MFDNSSVLLYVIVCVHLLMVSFLVSAFIRNTKPTNIMLELLTLSHPMHVIEREAGLC